MAESFSEIGKIEAIEQLYRLSAYSPVSGLSYTSPKGGRILTAARMYLEGIDFNLVYNFFTIIIFIFFNHFLQLNVFGCEMNIEAVIGFLCG